MSGLCRFQRPREGRLVVILGVGQVFGIGVHPLRVTAFRTLAHDRRSLFTFGRDQISSATLVINAVIPSRQNHAAGKRLFKPGKTCLHLLPPPIVPRFPAPELPLRPIPDLDDVQEVVGVPNHILAERTPGLRLLIDHIPSGLGILEGHTLPHVRREHIHADGPQHSHGAAFRHRLPQHGVGRRLVFLKGMVLPAVAGAGEAPGEEVTGIPIPLLGSLKQRLRRSLGPVIVTAVVQVFDGLVHHVTKILAHDCFLHSDFT